MPDLTGTPIVTNYGKTQIVSSTMDVTKVKLGSGIWTPTAASTALQTQEADLPASGSVEADPQGGSQLRINAQDGSGAGYDVHEFALTDNTDQALVIYSQAAIIDTKAVASTLLFVANLSIREAGPGDITVSGPTTFDLPQASESVKGIVEFATDAEAAAGVATDRVITPKQYGDVYNLVPNWAGYVQFGAAPQVLWEQGLASVVDIDYPTAPETARIRFGSSVIGAPGQGGAIVTSESIIPASASPWYTGWVGTTDLYVSQLNNDLTTGAVDFATIVVFGAKP